MKKFRNKKLISLLAILLATACGFGLYAYNIKTSTNNTEEAVKNENGTPPDSGGGPGGGPPGQSSSDITYTGAVEISSSETQTDKTYSSTSSDENALLIKTSEEVTINNPTVTKSGDSDGGDNSNFYGLNAGILVKDGSKTTIIGATINTSANGANGVFS